MYFVYIIYSSSLGKYYVGSTDNVTKRLSEHNNGKGNFTSKGMPWTLITSFEFVDRSNAIRLELKVKKRGAKRYLQDINFAGNKKDNQFI